MFLVDTPALSLASVNAEHVDVWVSHIVSLLQQFLVVWAAVHAGNKTALKEAVVVKPENGVVVERERKKGNDWKV